MALETMVCTVDSHAGVYAPREFIQQFESRLVSDIDLADDIATINAGPDGEFYWEAWEVIERDGKVRGDDGTLWAIHQDGDIFLVHPNHDWSKTE